VTSPAPSPSEGWSEDDVLTELRELSALIGAEHCLNAEQLSMRPESFPDPWEGDMRSMRRLLQRLMVHAGLANDDLDLELTDARTGVEELGSHLATQVDFLGWFEGRAEFVVVTLGDPRATIGPACVEVGRAVIHKLRIGVEGTSYRRDDADPQAEVPTRHEGFVAASLLGWGMLVTNASFDPRSVGRNIGYQSENAWLESTVEVEPGLAAWVLAVLWRARPDSGAWSDALREELNPSQRKIFDREFADLQGQDEALRGELGWSPELAGRGLRFDPLRALMPDARDDALDATEREAALARQRPNRGQPIFRVRRRRTLGMSVVGLVVATLIAASLQNLLLAPLLVGLAAALGYTWRTSYCSDPACHRTLSANQKVCDGCGGFVAGEIDQEKKRLEALEAYEEGEG